MYEPDEWDRDAVDERTDEELAAERALAKWQESIEAWLDRVDEAIELLEAVSSSYPERRISA